MKILILILLLCVSIPSYASPWMDENNLHKNKWYSKDESKYSVIIKGKLVGVASDVSSEYSASGINVTSQVQSNSPMDETFMGADFSAGYTFNQYVVGELSLGFFSTKEEDLVLDINGAQILSNGRVSMMPIEASVLLYPAPFGEVKPYVGLGYNYTYVIGGYEKIDFEGASGVSTKLGLDWWWTGNYGVNFEVSKKFLNTEIDYTRLVGGNLIEDIDYNPITASIGVVYRF